MTVRGFIERGGAEIALGLLWVVTSLAWAVSGGVPPGASAVDVAAFVGLLFTTRFHVTGSVVMMLALAASFLLPPDGLGVAGAIVLIGVVSLLRTRGWRVAGVLTVVTVGVGIAVSLRGPGAANVPGTVLAWLLSAGLAWAIGFGFRGQAQLAAAREREVASRAKLKLAHDLHDFVARYLTLISLRADAAMKRGGADVEELEAIAEHSRSAAQFLRETAQQLVAVQGPGGGRVATVSDAIADARRELASLGRSLDVEGEADDAHVHPMLGRLLVEALHNAIKHGEGDVHVRFTDEPAHLSVEVANISTQPPADGSSLGLDTMGQRAEMFGGSVQCQQWGNEWMCRIRLPKVETV